MNNIDQIIETKGKLEAELRAALSTMELKNSKEIKRIKREISKNQAACPHFSMKYNWAHDGRCPYCGKIGE